MQTSPHTLKKLPFTAISSLYESMWPVTPAMVDPKENDHAKPECYQKPARYAGFSLIELSIVLVIVGLVIGAILVGQNMIRQSQFRQHIADMGKIMAAVNTFKLEYQAYPGDMNNASSYWPSAVNGNGNGSTDNHGWESLRFWNHLSHAGYINGYYTGTWAPGVSIGEGEEIPPSGLDQNLGWWQAYYTSLGVPGYWSHVPIGHYILTATDIAGGYYPQYAHTISPEDAMQIDQKADDGKPLTGKVLTWNNGACVLPPSSSNTYHVNYPLKYCWLLHNID